MTMTMRRKTKMRIKRTIEIEAKMKIDQIQLGDVISFKLQSGEKVEARAIKEMPDGNMLMWFEDCLKEECAMNEDEPHDRNYLDSDLRSYLNTEIIGRFPDKLVKRMVADYNGDFLHLLSVEEVFGLDGRFNPAEGQIPYLKDRKHRIKSLGKDGDPAWYWLRSPYASNATYFCSVNANGAADYYDASNAYGLAPAFYLSIKQSASLSREKEENNG